MYIMMYNYRLLHNVFEDKKTILDLILILLTCFEINDYVIFTTHTNSYHIFQTVLYI